MKALVVYDSVFGNTKKVAQVIAAGLGTGEDIRLANINTITPQDTMALDLLIVGSPTHRWHPTEAIKAFLGSLQPSLLSGVRAAAFDTEYRSRLSGSAAKKIEKALRRQGCSIVAPALRLFVTGREGPLAEGELDKATAWAKQILEACETKSR
jgi:flavodoxin